MPLCGSSTCGCAIVSVPATAGSINGALPTIDVAGNGTAATPWNLTLDDEWAAQVAMLGVVDYAVITSNQASITTVATVTGLEITWTAATGRLYLTTAEVNVFSSVANDIANITIVDGSNTQLQIGGTLCPSTSVGQKVMLSNLTAGTGASVTRRVRAARAAGTGSLTIAANALAPGQITVMDIGPTPA